MIGARIIMEDYFKNIVTIYFLYFMIVRNINSSRNCTQSYCFFLNMLFNLFLNLNFMTFIHIVLAKNFSEHTHLASTIKYKNCIKTS